MARIPSGEDQRLTPRSSRQGRVIFVLPCEYGANPALCWSARITGEPLRAKIMAGGRILIVEDERIIAIDLQRRLTRLGYTVIALAASGTEAIQKASALRPDVVLMD